MSVTPVPISVIVPCYRCSDTIARAIDSILKQTWPVAEILLVEDCSGDGTLATLELLREQLADPRLRILPMSQNGGPGLARNAGWDAATCPWLAFLDADDAWHPRKIELQFGWLQTHPEVVLCAHDTALWREDLPLLPLLPVCVEDVVFISPRSLLFRNPIPTRSVILRKDVTYRFGDKRYTEDYMMWLEVALNNNACHKIPLVLAYSFRPEFSPGGYSGTLWVHEKRELRCYHHLYLESRIGFWFYLIASGFSLLKFIRRLLLSCLRRA